MPYILDPNPNSSINVMGDLGYTYPNGLNLRPDGELHKKIVTFLWGRLLESSGEISKRYETWKKIDRSLTAFIPLNEAEEDVKEKDSRKAVPIVIPFSYATLETLLTYMMNAFTEYPIFRYDGVGPEDIVGAALLEKIIEVQTIKAKMALNLHTFFRDCFAYGFGALAPVWSKTYGKKAVVQDNGWFSSMFGNFMGGGGQRVEFEDSVLYEGNILRNIDPYHFLPDPTVPIHEPQKGEFVGWIDSTNYIKLLETEKQDASLFNVKYLKDIAGEAGYSQFNKEKSDSGRYDRYDSSNLVGQTTRPIDVIYMYVNLIPEELGIGSGEYPEKWLFGLAADKVVCVAKPMALNHNMFPIVTGAPDSDGYSVSPVSRLEVVQGLQTTLDWMVNSHVTNVRKSINDMLIVDPSLINVPDLTDPAPGKLVRLRRAAWGKGVKDAVYQLQVNDVTKQHIQDSVYLTNLMKDVSGSADIVMGIARRTSERVSATESRGTMSGALSRLAKSARLVSLQAIGDLSYMLASHTQQLMSKNLYVTVSGRWQELLMKEYGVDANKVEVDPLKLAIDYDVVMKDGSVPDGSNVDGWLEVYQIMAQNPLVGQQFDMVRVFLHIARLMGAKDVNEFVKKGGNIAPKVLPDKVVAEQAQAGNIIPIGEVG